MNWYIIIGAVVALGAAIRGNWSPCGESLQAQLHPMGELSRGNIWVVTIAAFTAGSALAGATIGALSGVVGSFILDDQAAPIWSVALVAIAAGIADLSPMTPLTPRRQVNENWIGRYRGWVYGFGFGLQLGVGFAVFVMSWGYYAMILIALLSASPALGAALGVIFGLGRGVLLYLSLRIDTPVQLASFHRRMARLKQPVFMATGVFSLAVGMAYILG